MTMWKPNYVIKELTKMQRNNSFENSLNSWEFAINMQMMSAPVLCILHNTQS